MFTLFCLLQPRRIRSSSLSCNMVLLPTTRRSEFDSSDEEDALVDQGSLDISWIPLPGFEHEETTVAISPLPGCRFAETRRSLIADLENIRKLGIEDVFVLCTSRELRGCRVPTLFHELASARLTVHNHPIEEGEVPSNEECVQLLKQLIKSIKSRRPALVHCFNGLGRSCLVVALLIMSLDESLTGDNVIEKLRSLRGPGAVQTVRQYNMIQEFREIVHENQDLFSGITSSPVSSPARAESR